MDGEHSGWETTMSSFEPTRGATSSLAVTPLEKLDAVRAWVDTGIGVTLGQDPSGFLLGIESISILEALDDIEEALRGNA